MQHIKRQILNIQKEKLINQDLQILKEIILESCCKVEMVGLMFFDIYIPINKNILILIKEQMHINIIRDGDQIILLFLRISAAAQNPNSNSKQKY